MNIQKVKSIMEQLREHGALDYGSVIDRKELLPIFGIYPLTEEQAENMTLKQIQKRTRDDALSELDITDRLRYQLLKEGKYFAKNGEQYRVALPSENVAQSERYMSAAQRKIRRAKLLLSTTPPEHIEATSQVAAQILISEQQNKKRLRH